MGNGRCSAAFCESAGLRIFLAIATQNKKAIAFAFLHQRWLRIGAADEARTRYLHLGKVALYQMSYGRISFVSVPVVYRRRWLLYRSKGQLSTTNLHFSGFSVFLPSGGAKSPDIASILHLFLPVCPRRPCALRLCTPSPAAGVSPENGPRSGSKGRCSACFPHTFMV